MKGASDATEEEASKSIWIVCLQQERRGDEWEQREEERKDGEKKNVEVAVFNRNSERSSVEFINMTSHPL